jgi:hypothetical protein
VFGKIMFRGNISGFVVVELLIKYNNGTWSGKRRIKTAGMNFKTPS